MNDQLKQTKDFLERISYDLHRFIAENITDNWVWQVMIKIVLLLAIIYAIDLILKFIVRIIISRFAKNDEQPFLKALYHSKVVNSVAHILALFIGGFVMVPIFQYTHKQTFGVLERVLDVATVLAFAGMAMRMMKTVELYYTYKKDFYRIVALNAISQTLKIFGAFIFGVILIMVIFGISSTTILGSLGAVMAVLVLVFRDTILGFVTGIHVATSKSLKVGDWIGIPKYNLEGTVKEINLITTKIENFDKTVSTIPTYDLLSTEIKNMQVMSESNTRRIKRSIIFNINSFQFVDEEMFEKYAKVNLIKKYLEDKRNEIINERNQLENQDVILNGNQLTNIGVFRVYALNYLMNNKHIDQENTLMVRQLENTPQGMPLEIYAFTNDSVWLNYEGIQSDIFDHLLVASKYFDLEVMQFVKIENKI